MVIPRFGWLPAGCGLRGRLRDSGGCLWVAGDGCGFFSYKHPGTHSPQESFFVNTHTHTHTHAPTRHTLPYVARSHTRLSASDAARYAPSDTTSLHSKRKSESTRKSSSTDAGGRAAGARVVAPQLRRARPFCFHSNSRKHGAVLEADGHRACPGLGLGLGLRSRQNTVIRVVAGGVGCNSYRARGCNRTCARLARLSAVCLGWGRNSVIRAGVGAGVGVGAGAGVGAGVGAQA